MPPAVEQGNSDGAGSDSIGSDSIGSDSIGSDGGDSDGIDSVGSGDGGDRDGVDSYSYASVGRGDGGDSDGIDRYSYGSVGSGDSGDSDGVGSGGGLDDEEEVEPEFHGLIVTKLRERRVPGHELREDRADPSGKKALTWRLVRAMIRQANTDRFYFIIISQNAVMHHEMHGTN